MDKQVARRGRGRAIRFKQSSGHKLFSEENKFRGVFLVGVLPAEKTRAAAGDFVLLEKSKKERIRKLSTIGRGATCSSLEMGCDDVSDREDEELPSKRIKLPTKSMGDCNGVHLPSVPRKLRSAMKKRHRQSTSPSLSNSRKLLSGTESLNCDGVKKPCLKQGDRSPKKTVSGPITKDEEEVVETLYALAGLVFPNNEANGNGKVESETLDANASALPESKNSPAPAVEVGDIKLDPVFPCRATSSTSPSYVEGFTKGTDQVDLLNNPSTHYQPEFPNSGKLCIDSNNNVSHNQINISSLSAKVEQCNEKHFSNAAVNFRDPSELSLDSRLTQTVQQLTSVFSRKPEIAVELGTNIGSQVQKHDMLQESRKKGSGLWPGLASNVSHGAKSDSPLLQSPAATMPPWMDAVLSTSRASIQNGSSFAKVTKVVNGTRSCKKCAAHVYISHLIQSLKSSDSKDQLLLQPSQMRAHEGSEQGAFLGVNTYTNVKSGFNEVVSSSSIRISTAEKVPNEAKNGILQHKKLHLDQPSYTLASGAHTSPKQIFDFLSLSAGGGSSENNDSFSRGRYAMEPSSEAQVPYLHSPVQHHNFIPFPLTRSRYNSSASLDSHPPVAQQGQLLPSYGNPFCSSQANATALTKQPTQQQKLHLQQQQQQQFHLQQHQQQQLHLQQQQQRLWAARFAAQYRPAGTLAATAPSPSWQNIKQENCTLIQCGQALLSPSPSTLELVGPKYAPLTHHQQQQMAVTSFPPDRVKRSDHHLPSVYEESVGGYRAASALPLQLLCNERL
ncbi:uncharacterized protein LOC133736911 isoform X2 [Rosa rugosa]|uniref:uncharacterized protein LOC133736911 isoform X2 n=1 Tax=Rosa rugosa TaxID=74645 RepID=UPI002B412659|nr:uncharacterized protein LOC133736911 isoform X2 [Rosa rugosa]